MFNILQWNCRGLGNKYHFLPILIGTHRPSVICLQETRLDDHPDPQAFKHYYPYRRHVGHGVAVYIHKTLPQTEVTLNTTLEAVACRVKFNDTYVSICSLYCSPAGPLNGDELESLVNQLPGNKLLLGDFNAHHHQWGSERCSPRGEQIANHLIQTNLCLLNDGSATRVDVRTGNASAIDLSLVSARISLDFSWEVVDDSYGSDHLPICISYSRDTSAPPIVVQKFNFKRADWASFTRIVDLDVSGDDIDAKVDNVQRSILHAAEATIPKTSTTTTKHRVPWWTPDCRQALRERNRRYRHFSKEPSQANFIAYKKARAQARKVVKAARKAHLRDYMSTVNRTTPLTQVWNTIHILNNRRPYNPIHTLTTDNGVIHDPPQLANALAHHFHTVSSTNNYPPAFLPIKHLSEQTPPDFATEDIGNLEYNSYFTMNQLILALHSCRNNLVLL